MNEEMRMKELISRYIDGEVTSQEKEIVEKCLKESPEYLAYYNKRKKLDAVLKKNTFDESSPDWENKIQSSLIKDDKKQSDKWRGKKSLFKMSVSGALVTILTIICFSTYTIHLDKFVSLQDTLVYAQDEFEAGSKAGIRVVTLNSKDSKPIKDAELTIAIKDPKTKKEKVVYKGKASSIGSPEIQFDMPDYEEGDYEIIIKTDSKYGHDKIIKPIKIRKLSKILLTTDKPLYQPGQTIHIRALALKSSNSTPIDYEELTFEVEDPKGNKVYKKKIETSDYGIAGTTFTLANEINMGRYTIRASIADYSAEKKVEVKKYVLPKFKIDFKTDRTYYLPNQTVKGEVNTNYFFGKATNNAEVKIEIRTYEVNMQLLKVINGRTDAQGFFQFEYSLPHHFVGLPLEKESGLLFFDISVIDQAQHKEEISKSVPIAKDPIDIELIPESGDLVPSLENIIYVVTSYPDGKPAIANVNIKGQDVRTNKFGIAEVKVKDVPFPTYSSKTYRINATAQDSSGNRGSASEELTISSGDNISRNESVLLRTDRSILDVGDTVYLQIFTSQSRGTVYLDIIKNKQTVLTKALDVEDRIAELELDLDESMTGTLELHAYKVLRTSDIVRDTKTIFVHHKNDLQLDISSDKNTYLPGELATINFATSKDRRSIPSAIGVNIVDESVFALQEMEPGFERLYFLLEKELMTPRAELFMFSIPGLIEQKGPILDEDTRVQVGNILMSNAPVEERFPIQFSSREENLAQIEIQKDKYFNIMFNILFIILLLMPLSALILTIYTYRHKKLMLLKDLGASFLVLLGAFLLISLILFLLFAAMSTITRYIHPAVSIFSILGSILIAYIASFIILTRYAQKKNLHLLWVNILSIIYILLFLLAIAILNFGQLHTSNIGIMFLIVLSSGFVFAILYAKFALEFIKTRSRLAYLSLIMAVFYTHALSVVPMQMYAERALQARVRDASVFLEQQTGELGDTLQYEPYYLSTADDIGDQFEPYYLNSEYTVSRGEASLTKRDKPRIRRFFPETLYSNPQIITDESGKASISLEMADSITSWRLTALANSLNGNIGSGNLAMIVFQDFFVDIDLPVTLTQEDEVSIPIAIYNYLKTPQNVSLEMQQEGWFELIDEPNKSVNIEANGIDVVYFRIKAKRLGKHNLTVLAYGEEKSDAISRDIEIVPDGKEMRISYSDMLDNDIEKVIAVPEQAIEDSERLFVKIYPGVFTQVVEGLDSILKMPFGCFEQTSSVTYPNLLALDYMKSTKQISPEIQMKAEHYISTGYQRLLTFEAVKGGFSIFGKNPAERIVTAYGLTEFTDMSRVYDIDNSLIPRIQQWLLNQMEGDHWTPDGHYGAAYKARNSDVGATSYIVWALLHSGFSPRDSKVQKALDFIEREYLTEKDNPYALALVALSLSKGKRNARPVLEILDGLAQKDKDVIYWKSGIEKKHSYYMGEQKVNWDDVETTALVSLAYLEENYKLNDLTKTMKYLIKSKDSFGNWGSTQATVLSMKALLDAVTKASEGIDARINIFVDNEKVQEIIMNEDNRDVMQLIDLKPYAKKGSTNVYIQFEGEGGLLYQIVSSYFLKWGDYRILEGEQKETGMNINLDYDKTELKTDDIVTANVDVNFTGVGTIQYAMIDLGIPPGFQVLTEDLNRYVENESIEKFEMTGRQLSIYIEKLDSKGLHLKYRLKAKFPIKGKTPKSSVYDYYDPDVKDEAEPIEMTVVQ